MENLHNYVKAKSSLTENTSTNRSNKGIFPVKVVDIILDSSHRDYELLGSENSIGAIRYKLIHSANEGSSNYAYPLNLGFRKLPLINEMVYILQGPTYNDQVTYYYLTTIDIWNSTHVNPKVSERSSDNEVVLGDYFTEKDSVSPSKLFEGDTIIEGRFGQVFRMGADFENKTPWKGEDNQDPIISIATKNSAGDGIEHVAEDYTNTTSIIQMLSNHTVDINDNTSRDSYEDSKPDKADKYKGNQIVLNSGRLYFKSDSDHILMSSNNSIGMSGDNINIDAKKDITLESSKIRLGVSNNEPALKGDTTVDLLKDLLDELGSLSSKLTSVVSTPPGQPIPQLIEAGASLNVKVISLKTKLNSLLSKKVHLD